MSGELPLGLGREYLKFYRYDALWHWEIMTRGYEAARHGNSLVSHYSITWPALMNLWATVTGSGHLGMMFFNCIIFAIATLAVAYMAKSAGVEWWKPASLLCCYPTAYFANSIYNEPIFVLLTALSIAMVLRREFFLSGLFAGMSVSIRVNAWAQVAAWLYSIYRSPRPRPIKPAILGMVTILIFASLQPLAIWFWRGSPVAHYKDLEKVEWMASPQIIPFKEPAQSLTRLTRDPSSFFDESFMFSRGWSAIFLLAGVIVLAVYWRSIPQVARIQGIFTILGLGMLEQAISIPRYMMAFMPFYFAAARLPPWALGALCSLLFWTQCEWASRFIKNMWSF
jgi:xanthosine utilization system XapX-like protein